MLGRRTSIAVGLKKEAGYQHRTATCLSQGSRIPLPAPVPNKPHAFRPFVKPIKTTFDNV